MRPGHTLNNGVVGSTEEHRMLGVQVQQSLKVAHKDITWLGKHMEYRI